MAAARTRTTNLGPRRGYVSSWLGCSCGYTPALQRAALSRGAIVGSAVRSAPGSNRAEFRMNVISDATWMKAVRSGLRKPRLASTMPTVSTAIVPTNSAR